MLGYMLASMKSSVDEPLKRAVIILDETGLQSRRAGFAPRLSENPTPYCLISSSLEPD